MEEFVLTQNAVSNAKVSLVLISQKETLFWAQTHTYILLFQRSFFMPTLSCSIHVPLWPSKLQPQTIAETGHVPQDPEHRLRVSVL